MCRSAPAPERQQRSSEPGRGTHNEGAGAPGAPHTGGHDHNSQHSPLPPDRAREPGGTRVSAVPSRPQAPAAARPPSTPPRRRRHRKPFKRGPGRPAEAQRAIPGQRGATAARMAADGTHHHPGGAPVCASPAAHGPHPTMHRARREASPGREGKLALLGDHFRPRSMVRAHRAAPARRPSSPSNHREAGSLFAIGESKQGWRVELYLAGPVREHPRPAAPRADTELTATERAAAGRADPSARLSGD